MKNKPKIIRYAVKTASAPPPAVRVHEPRQRPLCCDPDCMWFCRLLCSIIVIAVCYYCAYTLISDTKLKFGMFVA